MINNSKWNAQKILQFAEGFDFRGVSKTQTMEFRRNYSFRLRCYTITVVYMPGPDAELIFDTKVDKVNLLLSCFRIPMEDGSADPGKVLPIDIPMYRVFSKYHIFSSGT